MNGTVQGCCRVRGNNLLAGRVPAVHHPKGEPNMTLKYVVAAAAIVFSTAAFAFHCPADMKKIDEAMAKNPQLTAAQMAEVKKFRAEGETLHKAGKHQESVDTLAKAMKILKIN
jgi:hypothetical protein